MCKCPDKCGQAKSFDDLCHYCASDYAQWLADCYEEDQDYYYESMEKMSLG